MWYVYLVRCADETLYCGITTDVRRRLDQHNGLKPGGARYTRSRRPVRLEMYAEQPDRSAAARLESRIQRLPRSRKAEALASFACEVSGGGERTC